MSGQRGAPCMQLLMPLSEWPVAYHDYLRPAPDDAVSALTNPRCSRRLGPLATATFTANPRVCFPCTLPPDDRPSRRARWTCIAQAGSGSSIPFRARRSPAYQRLTRRPRKSKVRARSQGRFGFPDTDGECASGNRAFSHRTQQTHVGASVMGHRVGLAGQGSDQTRGGPLLPAAARRPPLSPPVSGRSTRADAARQAHNE